MDEPTYPDHAQPVTGWTAFAGVLMLVLAVVAFKTFSGTDYGVSTVAFDGATEPEVYATNYTWWGWERQTTRLIWIDEQDDPHGIGGWHYRAGDDLRRAFEAGPLD